MYDKAKRMVLKYKIASILIVAFIAIFVVPILINAAFRIPAPFAWMALDWDVRVALSFYGVLLGSVIGVVGVFLSIRYAQSNYREDVRNRVLPFFAIELIAYKTKKTNIFQSPDNTSSLEKSDDVNTSCYIESNKREFCFTIKEDGVSWRHEFTPDQWEIIEHRGRISREETPGITFNSIAKHVYIPIKCINVGMGAAVNLRIGLNRVGEHDCITKIITLVPPQDVVVRIFCEDFSASCLQGHELTFMYNDIHGTTYKQTIPIQILKDDTKDMTGYKIHFLSTQINEMN